MQLYLIRHTRPDIASNRCYGQSDIGLADSFHDEFRRIVDRENFPSSFDCAYSSPLRRCLSLAHRLTSDSCEVDSRLQELSFGDWELREWERINRQELDRWADDIVRQRPPGGESLQELYQRTEDFLEDIARRSEQTVAAVTHAGVIRCAWAYVTQMPLRNIFRLRIEYGDTFVVTLPEDRRLQTIGKL